MIDDAHVAEYRRRSRELLRAAASDQQQKALEALQTEFPPRPGAKAARRRARRSTTSRPRTKWSRDHRAQQNLVQGNIIAFKPSSNDARARRFVERSGQDPEG